MIHGRRPHAPCRGAACRSRRNAADSNGPPLKWQRLPDLSLRGRFAPVAISGRQLRFRRGFPVIHPGTARFPRRFAPRNGNSDSLAPPNHHCNTRNCRRRSLSAATDAIGWYVLIGSLQTASAFPRLPRPLWGLAMTRQGSAAMGTVRRTESAVLLPLRGRAGHAPPLQGQCGLNGGRRMIHSSLFIISSIPLRGMANHMTKRPEIPCLSCKFPQSRRICH